MAAGHRPCAECGRTNWLAFCEVWPAGTGDGVRRAADLDRALHAARVAPRSCLQRCHDVRPNTLPDGAFIAVAGPGACLVLGDRLLPWSAAGYGAPLTRPVGAPVVVLTPAPTVAALRAGYRPLLHPSASG